VEPDFKQYLDLNIIFTPKEEKRITGKVWRFQDFVLRIGVFNLGALDEH